MAKLTDKTVRTLKPKANLYRKADGKGLCIEVSASGGKRWRYRYRHLGTARMVSLGTYPAVSLSAARLARDEAAKLLADGADPVQHRKLKRAKALLASDNTFEAIALEWVGTQGRLAPITRERALTMLKQMAFPLMGKRPISEITPQELLISLRRVEAKGHIDTAQRLKQRCGQIFRYAIATGRAERDPSADLKGALKTVKTRHHAAVTDPPQLATLLRDLDGYGGNFITSCAVRIAPLLFVRPGELRHAEWSEIDFDSAIWRIPASKMKMRRPHLVPLSVQALAILRELSALTGTKKYLFPSIRTGSRPMSENTVNAALRRLGYSSDQATGHGFRTTASTRLHEMGWNTEAIERQLAHAERNQVKAAYNHAEHLGERTKMMQAWADYLDALKSGKEPTAAHLKNAA